MADQVNPQLVFDTIAKIIGMRENVDITFTLKRKSDIKKEKERKMDEKENNSEASSYDDGKV